MPKKTNDVSENQQMHEYTDSLFHSFGSSEFNIPQYNIMIKDEKDDAIQLDFALAGFEKK